MFDQARQQWGVGPSMGKGEERGPDGNLHYYYRNKSLHWAAVGRSSFRVSIERDGMADTFYRNGRFGPGSGPGPGRAARCGVWGEMHFRVNFFSLSAHCLPLRLIRFHIRGSSWPWGSSGSNWREDWKNQRARRGTAGIIIWIKINVKTCVKQEQRETQWRYWSVQDKVSIKIALRTLALGWLATHVARYDIIAEVALMKLLAFHKSVNNFHGEAIVFFFFCVKRRKALDFTTRSHHSRDIVLVWVLEPNVLSWCYA